MTTVIQQWVGHCQTGGSDKVWAACFTDTGEYRSLSGKRGSTLKPDNKHFGTQADAEKHFISKLKEKKGKNYHQVAFDDPAIGIPSFGQAAQSLTTEQPDNPQYQVYRVTSVESEEARQLVDDPRYRVTEKINGERTILAFDGTTLKAYNRRGLVTSTPPDSALALTSLTNRPFVIDGERFSTNSQAGCYAAFDLLELDGEDYRNQPYHKRIAELSTFLNSIGMTSLDIHTLPDGEVPPFTVLIPTDSPEQSWELIRSLEDNAREGYIIRDMNGPYEAGDTQYVRKFKFRADLDAVVVGITPGVSGGSVNLGLYRTSDGKLVNIGNVRSGLNQADIEHLATLLATGQQPVITVSYLPARTIGTKLVEPSTSLRMLRTDKLPAECTTDQMSGKQEAFDAI